jgi:hypothetical protein
MERELILVIPGLFGPVPDEAGAPSPTLPTLELLLSRAELVAAVPPGLEALLFHFFGAEPEGHELPVAAVTRFLDMGVVDRDYWLRADPVHLRPERDRLILADHHLLDLSLEEAQQLVSEIMETYSADGWLLKAPRPDRWYLKPPQAPRITTTALPEVVGRDIHPALPQGPDGKAWHTILNEVQILLHTARVNSRREAAGKLPVNSLWFWGGGRLPRLTAGPMQQVWSAEPVSLGLARLGGSTAHELPAHYAAWSEAAAGGKHLVVLEEARSAVHYRDEAAWAAFIQHLEQNWMQPLYAALKARTLRRLEIYTDTGHGFQLTPRAVRRWWRRTQPLDRLRSATAPGVAPSLASPDTAA